jgi:hypothetical protein
MTDGQQQRPGKALAELEKLLESDSSDSRLLLDDLQDNPICAVSVDPAIPCLVVQWRRYATSAQLRYVHERMIALLRENGLAKILSDDTGLPTIHAEDQKWIVENWFPRAIAAGLRTVANKTPDSYFGKLSVTNIQATIAKDIAVRTFDELADARRWLIDCGG